MWGKGWKTHPLRHIKISWSSVSTSIITLTLVTCGVVCRCVLLEPWNTAEHEEIYLMILNMRETWQWRQVIKSVCLLMLESSWNKTSAHHPDPIYMPAITGGSLIKKRSQSIQNFIFILILTLRTWHNLKIIIKLIALSV